MKDKEFDVVIVGAGPAGCACAYQLSGKGIKVALLDKENFPRDKTCGDALSADVVNQLNRMDPELALQFQTTVLKQTSQGIRFFSPNSERLEISFPSHSQPPGFVAKRLDFDNFFFNQVRQRPNIEVFSQHNVKDIYKQGEKMMITTDKSNFLASVVVGADGANSVVARKLASHSLEKHHYCAGLRQYFENVSGFHPDSFIELHFYKDVLPGYFWIFPLPDNRANVGLAMLSSEISKKKINLRDKLTDIIQNHPNVVERFKHAKPLESIKGFGLPLGSKKRACSGDRFLLVGDAVGLIDPFSGEGIGNAIRSGRIASQHLMHSLKQQRFDADFNFQYDQEIYNKMWKELRVSRSMQGLLKYPGLINLVIRKARKNESIRLLLTSMIANVDLKRVLLKPSFYMKLIFK